MTTTDDSEGYYNKGAVVKEIMAASAWASREDLGREAGRRVGSEDGIPLRGIRVRNEVVVDTGEVRGL